MPDQNLNQNLKWADGQIGDYQIPSDYDQPDPVSNVYLSSDEVQNAVQERLNNNPAALAALYGIDENDLDKFLFRPDPTSAREAFRDVFEEKMKTKARGDTSGTLSSVTLEQFLEDPHLAALYKAAVREEVNSRNYKNAVFLNSINYYPGETLETPVYVVAGGASGVGKGYFKKPSIEAVVEQAPKKRNAQNEVVLEGNRVVSADNGIARNTLQVGKMLLQVAFAKGYKEISDYNEVTKASAKKQIKSAATEAGLSLYQPKTYSSPGAYAAVLKWTKKHDGYHSGKKKYDVVATNIVANEEVVRNQGVKRSQLQKAFSESDIRLNQRKMPAESKRYGRLIFNLDQALTSLRSRSFSIGQTKSSDSANDFQKQGIPVIDIDSTTRILVMFRGGKLERVWSDEAEDPDAFVTHQKVLDEWRKTGQTGTTEADVREFEKTITLDSPFKIPEALTETQALREAYADFYKEYNSPDRVLLSIENFNEFLRLTDMQTDSREIDRNKLFSMLKAAIDPKASESLIESACSKFLNSHYSFSDKKSRVKKQNDALLRSIVDLSWEEPLTKKAVTKSINELELSPDLLSNKLIDLASEKLEDVFKKMPRRLGSDFSLKIAINFLRKKRPWLPPPFSRASPSHRDEILIESIQTKLLSGQLAHSILSAEQQKDLGRLMQAAIELKKLNHQTKLSYAFRRLWTYLTGKEPARNNDNIKSAQESIIAAQLGINLKPVEVVEPPVSPEVPAEIPAEVVAPPAVVEKIENRTEKRTPTPSDAVVIEVEKRTPTLSEPTPLEVIQKTLESHHRRVKKDVLAHNRLWVGHVNPGLPKHPEPHYTIEVDDANKGALCYRVPLDQQGKLSPEALKLACEDAVFLAKKGDVLDISQTPDVIRAEVKAVLEGVLKDTKRSDLQIVADKGPQQTPRPTLNSP